MDINLDNTYWDRIKGYVKDVELRVDARWVLRDEETDKPFGSLRIVSHPDLPPGYLRAIFTYVVDIREKTQEEKLQTIEDYQMKIDELEVYSVHDDIKTETKQYEAPFKELEDLFGVSVFK